MTTETPEPRRIEYLPLSELTPDPKNPKAHDLDVLDESMGRFGYVEAISRDDRTGYVISGHGRRENLIQRRDRGESAPEGVQVRDDGEWLVPVTVGWASRTDTEATAALIALNRTTELGGWVDDSLIDALDSLDDYSGVGFSEDDIDDLRAKLEELTEGTEPDQDDGTSETPSLTDHADEYEEHGRRLIVLDYGQEDYSLITARLRVLRDEMGYDNNAEAVAAFLAQKYPDVLPGANVEKDALEELGLESNDPAATLDKE